MSDDRTNFVYRVFDEFGLLLYIGCTHDPVKRWRQHRTERKVWVRYATTFKMVGPYVRRDAFAREQVAIDDEQPLFNALKDHKRSVQRNWQEKNRRMTRLRLDRPDLFGAEWGTSKFAEFQRANERLNADVDADYPVIDDEWRHANYLSLRRAHTVRPA